MDKKTKQIFNVANYLRHRKGLTIEEVSEATGLAAMAISRIENGNYSPAWDKIQKLAHFYGVTMDTLIRNDFDAVFAALSEPSAPSGKMYDAYREINELCLKNGLSGERWMYLVEREKLKDTIYQNAICPGYADDSDAGFDILTYNLDGEPLVLEIKSTAGAPDTQFKMTETEVNRAKDCLKSGVHFEIRRVYYVNDEAKTGYTTITADERFSQYELIPCQYIVKKRGA